MLKQFLSHLSENKLALADDKILLAVSGGLDSMVMLDLFVKAGFSCEVAHVNFQLRGEESKYDESFVKKRCETYGVPCHVLHADTKTLAATKGISIQMAARELRYEWFQALLEKRNLQHIATAHHLNDSIETTLFNWINGASLAGLVGIAVRNGSVIRPLLFATRVMIEQYANDNDLVWTEDSSNSTDDYTRNFIRHQIIPKLREINPSLEETVARGKRKLAEELALIDVTFEKWKEKFVERLPHGLSIRKIAFDGIGHGAMMLYRLLGEYGFNFDVCEEIVRALASQSGTKFLSASYCLVVDRDTLMLAPQQKHRSEISIQEDQSEARIDDWRMTIKKGDLSLPSTSPLTAVLDKSKLQFPLVWRTWQPGDFFCPLGMEHRKKLSDFLVDAKVPLPEKERVTVLESQGEIVWVVGYRIDNRFKLTPETLETLAFTVTADFS